MHTGEVRRIDAVAIQKRLEDNELVLLSPLGYSPTGEVFNLALEDVAGATAIALKAEKLIFLMDAVGVTGRRGELLRNLTVRQAQTLLARPGPAESDAALYLPCAVHACELLAARLAVAPRVLDNWLWNRGQSAAYKALPRHRCRCVFY